MCTAVRSCIIQLMPLYTWLVLSVLNAKHNINSNMIFEKQSVLKIMCKMKNLDPLQYV